MVLNHLPIWESWTPNVVAAAPPTACNKCPKRSGAPLGPPLGRADILVILDAPTVDEAAKGRAMSSTLHSTLRRKVMGLVEDLDETVAYTYAALCPGNYKDDDAYSECRAYLEHAINIVSPKRIIACGTTAVAAMAGRYVDALRLRHAWMYHGNIPVTFLPDVGVGVRNRFYGVAFDKDLARAITGSAPTKPQGRIRVLNTGPTLDAWLVALHRERTLVVDVEHTGHLWDKDFSVLCVGMGQYATDVVVATPDAIAKSKRFGPVMTDPTIAKGNQNIKHDRQAIFRATGFDMAGVVSDTFLWSRLYDPEAPAGLGPQAWLVGMGGYKEYAKSAEEDDSRGGNAWARMAPAVLYAYNGRDISATIRLLDMRRGQLSPKTWKTWTHLINPAFDALTIVERNGMLVSKKNVIDYDAILTGRKLAAEQLLAAVPGVPSKFNPGSPKQVAELLFGKFKLPCAHKTKTGNPSADKESLEAIRDDHPIVPILMELATVKKQLSTYGLSMLEHVDPRDGRVHTTFKLVRTARLSSSEPNMQNITASENPGDEGEWARSVFVAPAGHKLINLDYSQMELRVAAMVSGDAVMAAAFQAGHDFHTVTAAGIFGVAPDLVTKAQRKVAKAINFGLAYGKDEYGFAKDLGCTIAKALEYMTKIFGNYAQFGKYLKKVVSDAEVTGRLPYSWGNWHFDRPVPGIGEIGASKNTEDIRKHARNVAKNTPIQGLANCFTLSALISLVQWTEEEEPRVKVVMTVHDSIVLEVPDDLIDVAVAKGREAMLAEPSGIVAFGVDAEVGQEWGRMVKYEEPTT